jgi:hypothetical protein
VRARNAYTGATLHMRADLMRQRYGLERMINLVLERSTAIRPRSHAK